MAITPKLTQVIQSHIDYAMDDLNVSIPARVLSYENETQKATVQPIIKERYRDTDSTDEERDKYGDVDTELPPIVGVPVIFPSANNGCINWPINKGDTVQLIFSQRSLDLWLHTEDEQYSPKPINPQDNRKHDYSDAIAIPGIYPFKRALGSHPEHFQIRYNVETSSEISISMTKEGDLIFDVPGKVKWNCSNWEMFNSGGVREQHGGSIVRRIDGDVRDDWGGKYELYLDGETLERRAGPVIHDYLSSYSMAAALDITRQSRAGKISDNAASDIFRYSDGNIDDSAAGDWVINSSGKADIKSGDTMTLQHSGILDLDGSGVAASPAKPTDVPEEPPAKDGMTFSPATIRFIVTKNSSFQYESKFFLIDNPTGPEEDYRFRSRTKPNWLTLSRPISTSPIEDWSSDYFLNGLGQDIVVVDLNEKTKDLPVGTYREQIVIERPGFPIFQQIGAGLFEFEVILEVRA